METQNNSPDPQTDKTPHWAEASGWYGMLAIMLAYLGVSLGWMSGQGVWFQLLNLTGALGLMVISWVKGVRQNVVLNLFWAAIAVLTLSGIF